MSSSSDVDGVYPLNFLGFIEFLLIVLFDFLFLPLPSSLFWGAIIVDSFYAYSACKTIPLLMCIHWPRQSWQGWMSLFASSLFILFPDIGLYYHTFKRVAPTSTWKSLNLWSPTKYINTIKFHNIISSHTVMKKKFENSKIWSSTFSEVIFIMH